MTRLFDIAHRLRAATVLFVGYGLTLVACEALHAMGYLPTAEYLRLCRTIFWPAVWLVENGGCDWLAELLKWAAR